MEQSHYKRPAQRPALVKQTKMDHRELRDTLLDPFVYIRPTPSHNGVL